MSKIPVPGVVQAGVLVTLVPVISTLLSQYFPEAQYWWSPVIVTLLAALAKAVQLAAEKPAASGAATPAAAAQPTARGVVPADGDDYTFAAPAQPSKTRRLFLG